MGWIVDQSKTYEIEVKSPEGEIGQVHLRKMNEGDYQDRQDLVSKIRFKTKSGKKGKKQAADDQDVNYMIGEVRKFDLRTSIVSWSLPLPLTNEVIRNLDPYVAEQIHDEIGDLNPFIFGDDEIDGAAAANAPNSNGSGEHAAAADDEEESVPLRGETSTNVS